MQPGYTGVYLQDACLKHRFIRSRDTSNIVERPERLRAVKLGLAAAISRIDEASRSTAIKPAPSDDEADLTAALNRLNLASDEHSCVEIVRSSASVDLLNNEAVKFVHGDIDGDVYLENLKKWTSESTEKIAQDGSEIPEGMNQGDLYLCPESIDAMQGALGTVCEAVDAVVSSSSSSPEPQTPGARAEKSIRNAFVAVRPPGHHCGEDTPSGFCFVNNVLVGAAHGHLRHGMNRAVVFDIDLHHGNGTQSIAWQINEETFRKTQELQAQRDAAAESGAPEPKGSPDLQIYYGSIHDVLSFPCEDGVPSLVQAASTSIHGPHGQYIENIHLQPYKSESEFWHTLYENKYLELLRKADKFIQDTGGPGNDVLVFISCGFDACEHEYEYMSRHGRKVPVEFYHRFTREAVQFAAKNAGGRLISVLEGGYSDRALSSGAMAHLLGLACDHPDGAVEVDKEWWSLENLAKLEKLAKKKGRGGRQSLPAAADAWLQTTHAVFTSMDSGAEYTASAPSGPPTMTLRERKPRSTHVSSVESSPARKGAKKAGPPTASEEPVDERDAELPPAAKKLPRVILHVRPPAAY